MLSEEYIENIADKIVRRQESVNLYILKLIAKRVKEIGEMSPSDIHRLSRLYQMGADVRTVNDYLSHALNVEIVEVQRLIEEAAEDSYVFARPFYDYRELPFIPFEKNAEVQRVVAAVENVTAGTLTNLSNSTATGFILHDLKNPGVKKFYSLTDTYKRVIDEAITATQSGVVDYNTAMRRTMQDLVNSGYRRVSYSPESGRRYTQRLDTAVRRNILDGVRAINQGVQKETGKQFGSDAVELTAHINPAEDHQFVQGHQFSNEEFEKMQNGSDCKDLQDRTYMGFDRPIGMWNCRHFTYSIIIGVTEQVHPDKELAEILRRNDEGYTMSSGKHLTMYECTQYQRKLETKIRYAREGEETAKVLGDEKLESHYHARVLKLRDQYYAFSKSCGLRPRPDKYKIYTPN